MNTDPGRVQRAVLVALAEDGRPEHGWLTVPELAARLAGPDPTRTELESVRRAVKELGRTGRAQAEYWDAEVVVRSARVHRGDFMAHRAGHQSSRPVLVAHSPAGVGQETALAHAGRESLAPLADAHAQVHG